MDDQIHLNKEDELYCLWYESLRQRLVHSTDHLNSQHFAQYFFCCSIIYVVEDLFVNRFIQLNHDFFLNCTSFSCNDSSPLLAFALSWSSLTWSAYCCRCSFSMILFRCNSSNCSFRSVFGLAGYLRNWK